ncbi:Uncharacterized protein Fot_11260 [Forsythia ovata]|uniref:Uncharacterized protein n=1 Tax=Forsythia ovata TaxID=205694 RepID=A0ABD1WJV8_9LAMI
MDKKFHSNTEEDEFENNDFNNYNEFETDVQVEDNDGSQLKDFEVESQYDDRKGKGKAVVCDKTNNESVHHGASEFECTKEKDKKIAAVYKYPNISDFLSSGKSKDVIQEIVSGTSALSDEINAVDVNDIVDFEEWFNMRLCKNNK